MNNSSDDRWATTPDESSSNAHGMTAAAHSTQQHSRSIGDMDTRHYKQTNSTMLAAMSYNELWLAGVTQSYPDAMPESSSPNQESKVEGATLYRLRSPIWGERRKCAAHVYHPVHINTRTWNSAWRLWSPRVTCQATSTASYCKQFIDVLCERIVHF
jgi:hypothetical protein